jgi:hypothetical protein
MIDGLPKPAFKGIGLGYQPAGNVSVGWYAATRRMVSCFTNLRLVRTGKAFPASLGVGARANASRGGLSIIGASAATSDGGEAVGKLVSIIMSSGHRWAELTRIIDLSNRASAKCGEVAAGEYRSAMKSIPRRMLPITKKYRPRGILMTATGVSRVSYHQISGQWSFGSFSVLGTGYFDFNTRHSGTHSWFRRPGS